VWTVWGESGRGKVVYTKFFGKLERRNHLRDLGLDGRIILKSR
jgi:hypothetical protein